MAAVLATPAFFACSKENLAEEIGVPDNSDAPDNPPLDPTAPHIVLMKSEVNVF